MRRLGLVPLIVMAVGGCENSTAPVPSASAPAFAISDAVHGSGNAHFFFLPPMVSAPSFSGTFDPSVDVVVHICVWTGSACGSTVATYTKTSGPGGKLVVVDPVAEAYSVKWHTKDFAVDPGQIYRVRVLVGAQVLGFADVQVVLTNKEAKNVNTGEFIPLVDEHILMVRFRIEQGAIVPVGPVTITIDATALSVTAISLDGIGSFPTAALQSFTLGAGSYKLYYSTWVSQPSVIFTVTNAGTVDYAAALDGILDGRGTTTLRVNGRTVQLDARPLSVGLLEVPGVFGGATALPTSAVQTLTLLPADYEVLYNTWVSQPRVTFTVTNAGTVDYAAALDGILDGRGTTTLRVNGRTVQLDARPLSVGLLEVPGVFGGATALPTSAVQTLTLLPADYEVLYNTWVSQPRVTFTVTNAGTVDYAAALDGILDGRGTTTLRVNGRTVQLDARPLSVGLLEVPGVFGGATALPTSAVQTLTLLPANHQVLYNAGVSQPSVIFTLTNAGTIDYAPALDGILEGRGTSTLRVNGRTIQVNSVVPGESTFQVFGVGTFPASSPLTLLPALHEIVAGTCHFTFGVMSDGTVAYDTSLYSYLTGAGTMSLGVGPCP